MTWSLLRISLRLDVELARVLAWAQRRWTLRQIRLSAAAGCCTCGDRDPAVYFYWGACADLPGKDRAWPDWAQCAACHEGIPRTGEEDVDAFTRHALWLRTLPHEPVLATYIRVSHGHGDIPPGQMTPPPTDHLEQTS